jgi:NADH:ubiquinone oxidoreductase subunit H
MMNLFVSDFEQLNFKFITKSSTVADISYGVLFILAVSGLNVYGIIIAG